jgi:hypothetical protein
MIVQVQQATKLEKTCRSFKYSIRIQKRGSGDSFWIAVDEIATVLPITMQSLCDSSINAQGDNINQLQSPATKTGHSTAA